jgi:hypothetical protein
MSLITEQVVARALDAFDKYEYTDRGGAIRSALTAVLGTLEQKFENEQVRRLREDGRCPCCGAEHNERGLVSYR